MNVSKHQGYLGQIDLQFSGDLFVQTMRLMVNIMSDSTESNAPPSITSLKSLQFKEISKYKSDLELVYKEKRDAEVKALFDLFFQNVKELEITAEEIASKLEPFLPKPKSPEGKKAKREISAPGSGTSGKLYKEPNSSKTWKGKGKRPNWLNKYIADGIANGKDEKTLLAELAVTA